MVEGEVSQIQIEHPRGKRRVVEPTSNDKKIIQKLATGTFIVIVLKMVVIRTVTLVAMPILNLIEKELCLLNSTSTADIHIVSTVYSSSSQYIQRLSVIMMIIITILQWFAHGYLFCNLYKFFTWKNRVEQRQQEQQQQQQQEQEQHQQQQQQEQQQQQTYNWRHFLCRKCWKGALVILSLCVLTAASVLIIAGDVTKLVTKETVLDCEYIPPHAHQIITYAYYASTLALTYILEVAERWIMVCFTATVGAMWHDGYENVRTFLRQNEQGACRNPEILREGMQDVQNQQGIDSNPQNSQEHSNPTVDTQQFFKPPARIEYVQVFHITAKCIKPIYKIFRSFFVFQWLAHIYLLFTQIVHLLYPWINNGTDFIQTSNTESTLLFHSNLAAIVFYAMALLIIYVCGLKMNSYRRRYIRKAGITQVQLLTYDRENKSIFTPRVPGTGLSISLESPGYMLGVVITMFGLVGALLAM